MAWSVTLLTVLACTLPLVPLRAQADLAALRQQVIAAESTFAASFARRDTAAFAALVAPDAVFFGVAALRGRQAVVDGWRGMLLEPTPPFSWRPETVEVLDGGTLAFSSGPVLDPGGKRVGTFNSVWRREADGRWLVVFDKGCPACRCEAKS